MIPANTYDVSRRAFLRRAGVLAGAGAAVLAAGCAPSSQNTTAATAAATPAADPDQLFRAGEFAKAEKAYTARLAADPGDAHAAAQLGYLALLSNRYADAERHLTAALRLAPDDRLTLDRLVDCHVRRDRYARAAQLLDGPRRAQFAALGDKAYTIRGPETARIPFVEVDPLPHVRVSVNGAAAGPFVLDTGAPGVTLSAAAAHKAGLRPVARAKALVNGREVDTQLGVLPVLRLGDVEVRNAPVSWTDGETLRLPNGLVPDGTLGTGFFSRFLTTLDYRGRALVLRRTTAAFRPRAAPQPLWLAGDHLPCTLGTLNYYGPRVICIDSGGMTGLDTSEANARRAGITVDRSHPQTINGGAATIYPFTARRVSIGDATRTDLRGAAFDVVPQERLAGFDLLANFSHDFFRPFAVTFDYTAMRLYVEG